MRGAALALAAAFVLAGDANAQTSQQWSQLVTYVGQQSRVMLEMRGRIERLEAENDQQRETLNATIAAALNERCRHDRLTSAFRAFAVTPPPAPVVPTWNDSGLACVDFKSPRPVYPSPLPDPRP